MTIRPAPASAEAVPTAGEQARRVLRRWPTLLLVWGLVLLLALLLGLLTPRSYTASTEVRVDPLSSVVTAAPVAGQKVEIATERKIAASEEVARRAHEQEKRFGTQQLRSHVSVSSDTGTSVLTFEAHAEDAGQAADMADALAQAYLDQRAEDVDQAVDEAVRHLDEQIGGLSPEADEQQVRRLREARAQALAAPRQAGAVITPADQDEHSSSPGLAYYLLAGLIGGFLLGVVAAAVRDRTDPRVAFPDRAAQILDAEVLEADAQDLPEQTALLWRRWGLRPGVQPGSATVLNLPADESIGWLVADSLQETSGAETHHLSLTGVDARTAEELDRSQRLILALSPTTRRRALRRLAAACRRADLEVDAVILLR
ncbi:hypothetical protein [Rothia kristinae]|uniref:hypothetical protein n=1 Tax=Rothia kristinae TaxID=37923 RepID=UPI0018CAECF8|nr:hypothetical protein [Rothia kristinae]